MAGIGTELASPVSVITTVVFSVVQAVYTVALTKIFLWMRVAGRLKLKVTTLLVKSLNSITFCLNSEGRTPKRTPAVEAVPPL
jgi:hypothetical protein